MSFSNRWMQHVRSREKDKVFDLGDGEGKLEPQMLRGKVVTTLFEHGGASSWHGWNAAAMVLVGESYR